MTTCTKDKPFRNGDPLPVEHPDAVEVGNQKPGWPSGDVQRYRCPHCGLSFDVELPQ